MEEDKRPRKEAQREELEPPAQFFTKKGVLPALLGSAVKAPPGVQDTTPRNVQRGVPLQDSCPGSIGAPRRENVTRGKGRSVPDISSTALAGASAVLKREEATFAGRGWAGRELRKVKKDIRSLGGGSKAIDLALQYFMIRMQEVEMEWRQRAEEGLDELRAKNISLLETNLLLREAHEQLKHESLERSSELERKLSVAHSDLEGERRLNAEVIQELELIMQEQQSETVTSKKLLTTLAAERAAKEEVERQLNNVSAALEKEKKVSAATASMLQSAEEHKRDSLRELTGENTKLIAHVTKLREALRKVSAELKQEKDLNRAAVNTSSEAHALQLDLLEERLKSEKAAKTRAMSEKSDLAHQLEREKKKTVLMERDKQAVLARIKAIEREAKDAYQRGYNAAQQTVINASFDNSDEFSDESSDDEEAPAFHRFNDLPRPFAATPSPSKRTYTRAPAGSSTAPSRLEPDPSRSMKDVASGEQVYYKGRWWYCRKNGSSCYIYKTKKDFDNKQHCGGPSTTSVTPARRR